MVQGQVQAYEMEHHKYPTAVSDLLLEGYLVENKTKCPNGNNVKISSEGKVTEVKESD